MSDIAALELQFTKTPSMDACLPLTEAYLEQSRFLEAMVVCKKGIKNDPEDPRGPAMMVRVFLSQGKAPKAEKELEKFNQKFGGHPLAEALQGGIILEKGDRDTGVAMMQQALQKDPSLDLVQRWLSSLGIAAAAAPLGTQSTGPVPQQPVAQQPVAQQPVAQQPVAQQPMPVAGPTGVVNASAFDPAAAQPAPATQPVQGAVPVMPGAAPQVPGTMPVAPVAPATQPVQGAAPVMPGNAPQVPGTMPVAPVAPGTAPIEAAQFSGTAQTPAAAQPQQEVAPTGAEHVSKFFDDDLGGAEVPDDVDVAGPGRLTIVGFVPKREGSIKDTLRILAIGAVIALLVGGFVLIQNYRNKQLKAQREAIDAQLQQDRYETIKEAATLAEGSRDGFINAQGAIAHALLQGEFGQADALETARVHYEEALDREDSKSRPWRWIAGAVLSAYTPADDAFFRELWAELLQEVGKAGEIRISETRLLREVWLMSSMHEPWSSSTRGLERDLFKLASTDVRSRNLMGWRAYLEGDFDKAYNYFKAAAMRGKGHLRSMTGEALAGAYVPQAFAEVGRILSDNVEKVRKNELPDRVDALTQVARGALRNAERKDGSQEFGAARALAKRNQDAMVYAVLGATMLREGKISAGVEDIAQAITLDGGYGFMAERVVDILVETSKVSEAAAFLKRVGPGFHQPEVGAILNARVLLAQAELGKAEEAVAGLKVDGDLSKEALTLAIRGQAIRRRGNAEEARDLLKAFVDTNPKGLYPTAGAALHLELAKAFAAAGDEDQALEFYRSAVLYQPSIAAPYYFFAKGKDFKGAEAIKVCTRMLQLLPAGPKADQCRVAQSLE